MDQAEPELQRWCGGQPFQSGYQGGLGVMQPVHVAVLGIWRVCTLDRTCGDA